MTTGITKEVKKLRKVKLTCRKYWLKFAYGVCMMLKAGVNLLYKVTKPSVKAWFKVKSKVTGKCEEQYKKEFIKKCSGFVLKANMPDWLIPEDARRFVYEIERNARKCMRCAFCTEKTFCHQYSTSMFRIWKPSERGFKIAFSSPERCETICSDR